MPNDLSNKIVLVTGASSGFGADAAKLFAKEGCIVVLTARRVDRLTALAEEIQTTGGQTVVLALDVGEVSQMIEGVQTILDTYGRIDILFNNAGFGHLDWLEKLELEKDIQAQIDVNLTGLIQMTRLVLPGMLARRSGTIINMASIAGWIPAPLYTVYAATKHGVRGFTNALRREVAPFGIKVCGIHPGGATTEFGQYTGSPISRDVFKKTARLNMSSEFVARKVVGLAKHPRRNLFLPWWFFPMVAFENLFPGLVDWVVKVFLLKKLHQVDS